MNKEDLRRSRSNPELVSGADNPDTILHYPKVKTESSVATRGGIYDNDTLAGPSKQLSFVEKDRGSTELCGSFSSRTELQLLVIQNEGSPIALLLKVR